MLNSFNLLRTFDAVNCHNVLAMHAPASGGKKSAFNTWEPAKQRQEWHTTVTAVFLLPGSWLRSHWGMEHVIPELFQLMAPWLAPQESTKAVTGCKHMCSKGCPSCSSCYHILFQENISLFFVFSWFLLIPVFSFTEFSASVTMVSLLLRLSCCLRKLSSHLLNKPDFKLQALACQDDANRWVKLANSLPSSPAGLVGEVCVWQCKRRHTAQALGQEEWA